MVPMIVGGRSRAHPVGDKVRRRPNEQRVIASGSEDRTLLRIVDIGSSPTIPTSEKVLIFQGFFRFWFGLVYELRSKIQKSAIPSAKRRVSLTEKSKEIQGLAAKSPVQWAVHFLYRKAFNASISLRCFIIPS